jgi:hypothetical protein
MNDDAARSLQRLRDAYAYPGAHLRWPQHHETPEIWFDLPGGRTCVPHHPRADEWTSLALDSAFGAGLRSGEPAEQQRALSSIVYWGFYTFGAGYATLRVARLIEPDQPGRYALGSAAANKALSAAVQFADQNRPEAALAALSDISQLSRTPFASKVVAFLSPQSAGVYDNRIQRILAKARTRSDGLLRSLLEDSDLARMQDGVGPVRTARVQARYAAWCAFLMSVAKRMNDMGTTYQWSDPRAERQPWRALDVERAIFQSAQ